MYSRLVFQKILLTLVILVSSSQIFPRDTHWFQQAGYGVFVHYLESLQNNPGHIGSLGKQTPWDECVREFDTERFADAAEEAGAGYVIFTAMQISRELIGVISSS